MNVVIPYTDLKTREVVYAVYNPRMSTGHPVVRPDLHNGFVAFVSAEDHAELHKTAELITERVAAIIETLSYGDR